jgi:hypothetical protein
MKLGLIFECDKQGTDQQVYEYVIRQLCPDLDFITQPAGINKPQMIDNCGKIAQLLIDVEKCDKILIIWDLMPRWGGVPCRKEDVDNILENLTAEDVDLAKIKLVCIEPELESWLIVDGKALTAYKEQLSHPHKVEKFKGKKLSPESKNAKTEISKYLGRKYNDISEALKIAQHIENYEQIARKHASFARLKEFIGEVCGD